KGLAVTITGMGGYNEAVVTKGGVNVREINPSTMESRIVKGLRFAGEVLDLDAMTGGFNLQIAWSTGYLAGRIKEEKKEKTMRTVNIAIDGPAGAGKSTIAKAVAKRMGYIYVDTGAMYRTIALYLLRKGISADDSEAISKAGKEADVTIDYQDGVQQVLLFGENVSGLIRTEEVGNMASASSVNKDIRDKMADLQRKLAETKNVVMDGRDIGTNVLPNAQVKVYLTASIEERARRRVKEYEEKGIAADYEQVAKDIAEREYRDMHREHAPLCRAEDAVLLDTSDMSIAEVEDAMIRIIEEKLGK
ncbi:MAG: (d)CMP kinase, partial [Lachnospiraceae bacterium]|nr:(d)CMP kinase [Lachnospiraceae bacterium]